MSRTRSTRRWVVVAIALALAFGVALWTTRDAESHPDDLDPRNPGPEGAQALANVLADEGVDVRIVRSADELDDTEISRSTTVVVTSTNYLSPGTLERARQHAAPGRLVLIDPTYVVTDEIDADLGTTFASDEPVAADCSGPIDGLTLEVDDLSAYTSGDDRSGCFATAGGVVLKELPEADVVLFGAGQALSNDQVTRADNAAVALTLLGTSDTLIWYVPDPRDPDSDDAVTLSSLIPRWIGPGVWLGALAVIGLMFWRFRRLGPLSTEPLPVVVRAVETARSRGRMYRKTGDRDHVARSLRRAARTDLATRLRLDRRADVAAVSEAAARHLGAPASEIHQLLSDQQPPPATDHDLVRLAQTLTRLRREVRRG